jgi:hypothetical protein
MDEMYGDSKTLKQDLVDEAMTNVGVNPAAREWLMNWIQA